MPGEPTVNFHSFVFTAEGEYVEGVRNPDHTSTMGQRILADGTVIGCVHDTDQMLTMHGMSHSQDGFSVVDMATTMNNGGTPNGRTLTGLMTDMDTKIGRGYVIDDGDFTTFDVPGSDWTTAWDMNPSRTIVGWFEAAGTSNVHGYLLEKWSVSDGALTGTYTTIDFPLTLRLRAPLTPTSSESTRQGTLWGSLKRLQRVHSTGTLPRVKRTEVTAGSARASRSPDIVGPGPVACAGNPDACRRWRWSPRQKPFPATRSCYPFAPSSL